MDRDALHQGWLHWRDEHGTLLAWQSIERRKDFLGRVARLGDRELGSWLWELAEQWEQRLPKGDWQALGGLRAAREDCFAWACECLPIDEVLQRASRLGKEDARWVFTSCLSRLGDASLPVLRDWLEGDRDPRLRQFALAGLLKHPASPARRQLLLRLWQDEDFDVVRAAMRGTRSLDLEPAEQTDWHRAWLPWGADERLELLRHMRIAQVPEATVNESLRWLREDPHADPYLIELVSKRLVGDAQQRDGLPVLLEGWQRDFARAETRWSASEGADPNAGLVRLSAWTMAIGRLDPLALLDGPAEDWFRRVRFLSEEQPEKPSYNLGKALLAQVARHPQGRAWLRKQCQGSEAWPRRLRVELALQLAPFASEEAEDSLEDWLRAVYASDYRYLGVVLQERWWKALATRPESWRTELIEVASNGRVAGTVREAAMRTLAARENWEPILEWVAQARPGEGVRLAASVLSEWDDARVAPALRERIEQAVRAVRAGGREAELAEETLVALQIALVQAGHWEAEDGRYALLAADLRYEPALRARLAGEAKPEHWPRELRLCAHLASQKRLAATIAVQEDRWLRMPGPFLAQLAELAWMGRDLEAALRLVRMAEIAIAGEAVDTQGQNAAITTARVRYLLAWQTEDWPRAMAYSLELWHRVQQGGRFARGLEGTLGTLDWRTEADPGAALLAGAWQAASRVALSQGQAERARWSARQAQAWVGRSQWARTAQVSLQEALEKGQPKNQPKESGKGR